MMAKNKASRGTFMKQYANNFMMYVYFPLTHEKFTISDIQLNTRISDIKRRLELLTGIPTTLQRLFYLDKDDLLDNSDLRSNDVVMSANLNLHVWSKWQKVIFNSFIGNANEILKSDIIGLDKDKEDNYRQLMNISLFVSANKGKRQLIETLIKEGADANWTTMLGRTALHSAAAQGQTRCIDVLLGNGANADLVDFAGKTPAMVANEYGHRHSEKQLFLFQWQKRANRLTLEKGTSNLMMHQQFDSGYPTWLKGATQQVYLCKTLPAGEFIGTRIDAPRCMSTKSDRVYSSQQFPRHQSNESKDTAYGKCLPKLSESTASISTPKQGKETYQDWLSRKRTEDKAKLIMDHQRDEEKVLKEGRIAKLNKKDHRAHLKFVKRQPIVSDRPTKKIDVYNEHDDFTPVFEQGFLRTMELQIPNC